MLALHLMAKTSYRRPSEIIAIDDEWAAYQFDMAVLMESLTEDGRPPKGAAVRNDWANLARK